MTVETFFEKFDLFADAPDAVEKMRELVLRMATAGRMAEQRDEDEPAELLLEKLFSQRDEKIAKGLVRSREIGQPVAAGDTIALPSKWARCTIAEVCELQTGATPSRQEPKYFGGNIRWLVSGDINQGQIRDCDGRITSEGLENSNCKIINPGSVLIALNGQGKTRATVAVLHVPAALNQSLVAMTPFDPSLLLPEYIFWNLRGRYYAIRDITGQDQRRGLNMKLVGQLTLPIPPLAEQKRIVAKVDELMGLCDRLAAQQQEREQKHAALSRAALARFAEAPTPANLEYLFHASYTIDPANLRKSILTMAVQGKLVEDDPNEEPIHQTCPEFTGTIADGLPSNWRLAKYRDLTVAVTSGSRGWKEFYAKTGAYFIRTQNIKTDRLLFDDMAYVDLPERERLPRAQVRAGDILITITGANVTKAARVEVQPPEAYVSQHIALTRPRWPEMAPFLHLCFISPGAARGELEKLAYGDKPGLNLNNIRDLVLPVPPLAEQKRIVAKVEALMALVDRLEAQQAQARDLATRLLAAAVAELTAEPGKARERETTKGHPV